MHHIVGDSVDRSVRVGIDRYDYGRFLHAGYVLDLSGYAAGNVKFWAHGHACLANLAVVVGSSGVDSRAACSNLSAKSVGEFIKEVEILLASHAVSSGHHYRAAFEVHF